MPNNNFHRTKVFETKRCRRLNLKAMELCCGLNVLVNKLLRPLKLSAQRKVLVSSGKCSLLKLCPSIEKLICYEWSFLGKTLFCSSVFIGLSSNYPLLFNYLSYLCLK